jgi:phosphoribosylformimino-5-aminoimidazole carboxamide ribotide isomerase
MNVIPAIDIKDGKCVRLYQGDFENSTEYSSDPAEIARQFARLAASDLHIVDLDGARSGSQQNREIVAAIASESRQAVQLGGGIRDAATVAAWLDAGVSRCVIGSLAIMEPDTVKAWLNRFGKERIVLALDVKIDEQNEPIVTTHGWTRKSEMTLFECIDEFMSSGLQQVLCTDVSRDGAMTGPNLDLYASIVDRYPDLELQASGGVRHIDDLQQLRRIGVPAAISGRALLDGKITVEEIESFLQSA